jgi:hypothetical protein
MELNGRAGHDYELLPPEAAIDPSEDAVSIDAAMAMRDQFAADSPAALALFNALVDLLTGDGRRHQPRQSGIAPAGNDRLRPRADG